jgi:hypothetical protein
VTRRYVADRCHPRLAGSLGMVIVAPLRASCAEVGVTFYGLSGGTRQRIGMIRFSRFAFGSVRGVEGAAPEAAPRARWRGLGAFGVSVALGLLPSVHTSLLSAQEPPPLSGSVSGRVLDQNSERPIADVVVRIGLAETLTDERGLFVLLELPVGDQRISFNHLSYGEHRRRVLVQSAQELMFDIRLSSQAIELAPLLVETLSGVDRRRLTSGHAMNEVVRPEIEAAVRTGMNLAELLRRSLPGASVQPGGRGASCATTRGASSLGGGCGTPTVYLDGVQISDPGFLYTTMTLDDIYRLEFLSIGEAGARYGSAGRFGVLLVETRSGPRPSRARAPEEVFLPAFDWSLEEHAYRKTRAFGSSFVGNALGVGIGLALSSQCFKVTNSGSLGLRTECNGVATMGVAFLALGLPAVGGSYATRWGGATERSQGRLTPSRIAGAITLASGYLLVIHGAPASRVAGGVVLALGVPTIMTISDRIFRSLR